jgi:hypothetical protein
MSDVLGLPFMVWVAGGAFVLCVLIASAVRSREEEDTWPPGGVIVSPVSQRRRPPSGVWLGYLFVLVWGMILVMGYVSRGIPS